MSRLTAKQARQMLLISREDEVIEFILNKIKVDALTQSHTIISEQTSTEHSHIIRDVIKRPEITKTLEDLGYKVGLSSYQYYTETMTLLTIMW